MKIHLTQLNTSDLHVPVIIPANDFSLVIPYGKGGCVNAYRSYTQAKWLLKQSYREGIYVTLAKIKRLGVWIHVEVHTENGADVEVGRARV